jgi:peptidoglycan/LPS O-acetylase OafA/YrhL
VSENNISIQRNKAHFYELDLLRFLAALAVVFFHYTFLNAVISKEVPTYPFLEDFFKYGYLGVELFFIISGFVILLTTINKSPVEFAISRVTRLYPAFWIALILTSISILIFVADDLKNVSFNRFLLNLSMIPEYLGTENIDPVYWTLQVEIKFYFWVLIVVSLKRLGNIEGFIMAWLFLSILEIFHVMHEYTHFLIIPEWAPYFSAGALFFLIRTQGFNLQRGLLLFLSYLLSVHFAIEGALEKTLLHEIYFSPIVVITLISLFYLMFIWVISLKRTNLNSPRLAIIGALTYPLYLIHNVIGEIAFRHFTQHTNKYLLLILVLVFMLIISFIMSRFLEPKLGNLLKLKLTRAFK